MASPELSDALYAALRHGVHVDVLIDPLADDEWRELDGAQSLDTERVWPLHDSIFEERPEQAPTLLRLPLSRYEAVEAWLTQAEREALETAPSAKLVCAFVVSDEPLAELGRKLTRRLNAQALGRALYFRYFDPRVFQHLAGVLTPEQWAYLLPTTIQWSYVDGSGQLVTHEAGLREHPPVHALRFDADQWFAIESIEHFNVTRHTLLQRDIDCPPTQTSILLKRVMAARRGGLSEPADVAHYVLVSTLLGKELDTQLPWDQVLDAVAKGARLAELVPA